MKSVGKLALEAILAAGMVFSNLAIPMAQKDESGSVQAPIKTSYAVSCFPKDIRYMDRLKGKKEKSGRDREEIKRVTRNMISHLKKEGYSSLDVGIREKLLLGKNETAEMMTRKLIENGHSSASVLKIQDKFAAGVTLDSMNSNELSKKEKQIGGLFGEVCKLTPVASVGSNGASGKIALSSGVTEEHFPLKEFYVECGKSEKETDALAEQLRSKGEEARKFMFKEEGKDAYLIAMTSNKTDTAFKDWVRSWRKGCSVMKEGELKRRMGKDESLLNVGEIMVIPSTVGVQKEHYGKMGTIDSVTKSSYTVLIGGSGLDAQEKIRVEIPKSAVAASRPEPQKQKKDNVYAVSCRPYNVQYDESEAKKIAERIKTLGYKNVYIRKFNAGEGEEMKVRIIPMVVTVKDEEKVLNEIYGLLGKEVKCDVNTEKAAEEIYVKGPQRVKEIKEVIERSEKRKKEKEEVRGAFKEMISSWMDKDAEKVASYFQFGDEFIDLKHGEKLPQYSGSEAFTGALKISFKGSLPQGIESFLEDGRIRVNAKRDTEGAYGIPHEKIMEGDYLVIVSTTNASGKTLDMMLLYRKIGDSMKIVGFKD